MSAGKYDYRLKISKSVYFQDGNEFPVDVPYLNFQQDGNVTLKGFDEVGEFEFTGHAEDQYLFLKKQYIGQHTVFYVGKLEENKLNLFFNFEEDNEGGKAKVDAGEFNALMEFEAEQFRFFRDGSDGESFSFFLHPDGDGKRKGLGIVKGKTVKISYKKKDDSRVKLQMKYQDIEKTFKVDHSDNNDLIVNQEGEVVSQMDAIQSFYIIEGMEYSFYLPYLTFKDDGTCFAEFTDNNGTFTILGHLSGEYIFFTKNYTSRELKIYYVGKFKNTRLEMAYSFEEGQDEELKAKVDNGEYMAYTEFTHKHYIFELEGQRSPIFLVEDGHKHRGFMVHEGRNYLISLKTKEGKSTKLKMKRNNKNEIRYLKVSIDHDSSFISLENLSLVLVP